ncbi:MAG: helix-turn-helix transcriptional regulator, partial [Proteobacteria bacterium]|nr:helix-turn-helix transcriptional regulator [Pseudomonadota bacterium]
MRSLIGEAARDAFVKRVRLEMAKQGLTREALAVRAEVKERTLGNLLAGQSVRDQTVAKVARVLGIELETLLGAGAESAAVVEAANDARASEAYGGYMLSAYEGYIGTYVAWRRIFSRNPEAGADLYRSVFEFDWDEQLCRLRFLELQRFRARDDRRVTASQGGGIYISPYTGLIQLLTTFQGALRLVTLTRFRLGDNRLRGLILTSMDREQFFAPAASPIFLERIEGKAKLADLEKLVGAVGPADAGY